MTLFRRPLWRDWCFWLGVAGVLACIPAAHQQADHYKALGAAIVYAGDLVVPWFFFGVLPASVRKMIRSRHDGRSASS